MVRIRSYLQFWWILIHEESRFVINPLKYYKFDVIVNIFSCQNFKADRQVSRYSHYSSLVVVTIIFGCWKQSHQLPLLLEELEASHCHLFYVEIIPISTEVNTAAYTSCARQINSRSFLFRNLWMASLPKMYEIPLSVFGSNQSAFSLGSAHRRSQLENRPRKQTCWDSTVTN